MKKLLLSFFLLVLLLCNIKVPAQPYQSMFSRDTTRWQVIRSNDIGTIWEVEYVFLKDTLISGDTCKLVVSGGDSLIFKEDLISGKVWEINIGCNPNFDLLMDYSLQKGDTFKTGYNPLNAPTHIVDSTYIENGRKHISFKYVDGYTGEHLEWIEGIGRNLFGINEDCNVYEGDDYLLCVYHGSSQVFANKYYSGNCHPLGIEKISSASFQIYPNPANQDIIIRLKESNSFDSRIQIINSLGQIVASDILYSGSIAKTIDVSQLPPGLYILALTNSAGTMTRQFQKL